MIVFQCGGIIMICRLCGKSFLISEMSEEHYPAHSVGNDDIVKLDLVKMIDSIHSSEISNRVKSGEKLENVIDDVFDNQLSETLYPIGRTARTLCRNCNTFLGKYDEAYLKFFNSDGDPRSIKGFQPITKLQIIKSIFGKFLSIPEALEEDFDFVNFVKDEEQTEYTGIWNIYFVTRDFSSDILGLKDIGTGKAIFEEGVVYELSDDKFIYNLLNFPKHPCFEMTNLFDILKKNYIVVKGAGANGGYHSEILLSRLFQTMNESDDK